MPDPLFITRWSTIDGKIVKFQPQDPIPSDGRVWVPHFFTYLTVGKDVFLTEEEARADVLQRQRKKVASLQKQIDKILKSKIIIKEEPRV